MADETALNGVDDQAAENFYHPDQTAVPSRKVDNLELEKKKLEEENEETKERIKKMAMEIEKLKSDKEETEARLREMEKEIERSEEDKKAMGAIAARAAELETDVSRLQHDLISAMAAGEEANAEVAELKRSLGEKGVEIETLEMEVASLKTAKTESEKRVRELERKIGLLEMKEIEGKSKKVRVEEEMRDRVEEKEKEIVVFKKKIEELESVIAKNGLEVEKWVKEKVSVEALLRDSEEKAKAMESKVHLLQEEVEAAQTVIREVKENTVEAVNGTVNEVKEFFHDEEKGLNLQWPIVAGSTAAIVAGAGVLYVLYGRPR